MRIVNGYINDLYSTLGTKGPGQGESSRQREQLEAPGREAVQLRQYQRVNRLPEDGSTSQMLKEYTNQPQAARLETASYQTQQALAQYTGTAREEERAQLNQLLGVDAYV